MMMPLLGVVRATALRAEKSKMTRRTDASLMLAALAGMGALTGVPQAEPKNKKPVFTEAELSYVRSLDKKEKKRAVDDLKKKYAEVLNGATTDDRD
jgi:hypothetical protein